VDFVGALGVKLDPWQWLVLRMGLRRRGGVWAAFAVAVCAPRQNGKNGILEMRELVGAQILGERLQIHSAHLADERPRVDRIHERQPDPVPDSDARRRPGVLGVACDLR